MHTVNRLFLFFFVESIKLPITEQEIHKMMELKCIMYIYLFMLWHVSLLQCHFVKIFDIAMHPPPTGKCKLIGASVSVSVN